MMAGQRAAILFALCCGPFAAASGQIRGVAEGSRVRVTVEGGSLERAVMKVVGVVGDSIRLQAYPGRDGAGVEAPVLTYAIRQVQTADLWKGQRTVIKKGFVIGALAGAVSGAALSFFVMDCSNGCYPFSRHDAAVYAGTAGAALGGIIGGIVGARRADVWVPLRTSGLALRIMPDMSSNRRGLSASLRF